jgi:hypothetical protein
MKINEITSSAGVTVGQPGAPRRESSFETAAAPQLDRLRLAARVALGLEPGILLRLRGMRPAELIFQGTSPSDVRLSLDVDMRGAPRLGAECLLPVDPFTVSAQVWADALLATAAEVPRQATTRRRRKEGGAP